MCPESFGRLSTDDSAFKRILWGPLVSEKKRLLAEELEEEVAARAKCNSYVYTPVSVEAAVTEYHRLGGLDNRSYFSQFWRLKVQDQGSSMAKSL